LAGGNSVAEAAMRTVILSISAATLLGTGVAFTVQAMRSAPRPIDAAQAGSDASAAAPQAAAIEITPMDFRQVRSVSIVEPKAEIEASHHASAEEERTAFVTAYAGSPEPAASVAMPAVERPTKKNLAEAAAPDELNEGAAASVQPPSAKPANPRNRHARHSRRNVRVQAASKEEAVSLPSTALAYDGSHDYHTPLYSLRKLLGGTQ
jgi:hypothetical protein